MSGMGLAIPAGVLTSLLEPPPPWPHISGPLRAGSLTPEPPYFYVVSFCFN